MINKAIPTKKCARCGEVFARPKKVSDDQWLSRKFCSKKCSASKLDVGATKRITEMYSMGFMVSEISLNFSVSEGNVRRILKENSIEVVRRHVSGGISITENGYMRFNKTKANGVNAGRRVHAIIAEMKIGRRLKPGEIVHHIDGDCLNNHPDNLRVMTRSQHTSLHKKGVRNA